MLRLDRSGSASSAARPETDYQCTVVNPLAKVIIYTQSPYLSAGIGHLAGSGKYTCDYLASTHGERPLELHKS